MPRHFAVAWTCRHGRYCFLFLWKYKFVNLQYFCRATSAEKHWKHCPCEDVSSPPLLAMICHGRTLSMTGSAFLLELNFEPDFFSGWNHLPFSTQGSFSWHLFFPQWNGPMWKQFFSTPAWLGSIFPCRCYVSGWHRPHLIRHVYTNMAWNTAILRGDRTSLPFSRLPALLPLLHSVWCGWCRRH